MTVTFDSLPFCVRLECLRFLQVKDLGRLSCASSNFSEYVSRSDQLWKELYPATFAETSRELSARKDFSNLINRPYKRECVGWSVSVLQSGTVDIWLTGVVVDFRNDLYLVRYDLDDREVWEKETISSGLWHTQGKLRIRFLSSPTTLSTPPELSTEKSSGIPLDFCPKQKRQRTHTFSSSSSTEDDFLFAHHPSPSPLPSPKTGSACIRDPQCTLSDSHSWRCEIFRDRTQAPTGCIETLTDHSDEVLCVCFSNDGSRLASCSRDGSTRVYKVDSPFCLVTTIQHAKSEVPCRVIWSPNDEYLLICTEAKNGNIFDYDATVACYSSETGIKKFSRPNIPFDVCACWIPNSTVFIHGQSLTVSPRGTYHQVLAMFDCISMRTIGRFHFRFNSEAFVHLIQVSPDGQFLAVSCGIGDGLSDTVRVVRIPDIARAIETKTSVEIRVPRNKFSSSILLESVPEHTSLRHSPLLPSIPISKFVSIANPCGDGDHVVPSFYCGGAVLGLCWSHDSRVFYTNTRLYVKSSNLTDRPDLDNTLEIQAWNIESTVPNRRIKGAHGFTTKDCPFYLFLSESPCGEYVASGSEDAGVYLYHVRHGRLMRVLWEAHEDVVSMVSWRFVKSNNSCMLASASDDKKVCIWSTTMAATHQRSVHL